MSAPDHTKLFLAPLLYQCCRRHCTQEVTDLWQATSALLGLVREPAQVPHASQCSILLSVIMQILFLTGQNISCFCSLCKIKGTATWEENPLYDRIFVARGGKIHQAINLLLHKSWVPRTWRDIRLTHSWYFWFCSYWSSYFIKQLAVRPFLLRSGKNSLFHPLNYHFSHDPNHSKSGHGNI